LPVVFLGDGPYKDAMRPLTGAELKAQMKRRKVRHRQVAALFDVTPQAVGRWAREEVQIPDAPRPLYDGQKQNDEHELESVGEPSVQEALRTYLWEYDDQELAEAISDAEEFAATKAAREKALGKELRFPAVF
jgi:hypothetical protein